LKIVTSITNGSEQIQSIDYQDSYLVGLQDNQSSSNFSVSPNPVSDILTVSSSTLVRNYQLSDITGKLLLQKNLINASNFDIDISDLPLGSYFISLNSENTSKKIKFIKL
jgi:hypothetical protein